MTTINIITGMTHTGVFHADDVFSSALLKILVPSIQIQRVFKIPENMDPVTTIVFDIGFGKFDHHQPDAEIRPNGIKYAAFGLLWREFGHLLVSKKSVQKFDETFVQFIDDADNGGARNPLSNTISTFSPNWDEVVQDFDTAFDKAVDLAQGILVREIISLVSAENAEVEIQKALDKSDNGIVVLDRFAPWQSVLVPSNACFVVSKSPRGGYNAQCVPTTVGAMDQKIPFPAEWVGNKAIDGLLFCHAGRFVINTDTLERAVELCNLAQEGI